MIVPTYGRSQYFRQSIDSALAQTYPDFEILIGDNDQSDAKRRILAEYDDPRIRYVQHPRNLGGQRNWSELVRLAESPIVASHHDDDVWHPEFLARLVPLMDANPDVDLVFCDFWMVGPDGERLEALTESVSSRAGRDTLPAGVVPGDVDDMLRLAIVRNAPQPAYAGIVRREAALIDYPDDVAPIYDFWLNYAVASSGRRFAYVPERLADYRQHGDTETTRGVGPSEDRAFQRIIEAHSNSPIAREIYARWAWLRWGRAVNAMQDPAGREQSQSEFRAAAAYLAGRSRMVAEVCGRSDAAWHAARLGRRLSNLRQA